MLTQGNLDRTLTDDNLPRLLATALAEYVDADFPDDTRAMLTYNISLPAMPEEEPRVVQP